MAIATQLFQLEQLDTDLDRRQADLASLRRRLQSDPELETADAMLADARERERTAALRQRELEGALADIEARIIRDNSRMYSGQIVDSRELASLEKELATHRETRDLVETDLLALMEALERAQAEVADLSRKANALRERREVDRPALERQAEEMTDALAGLRTERDAVFGEIDARTLALYERLRKSSGHAVSHVSNGVCQWCRVTLPPKDIQHARAGSLVTCTNCARILYAG